MTSTARTRRAMSVSAGALSLCLLSGGVAFADTGLPPVPSVPPVPAVPGVPTVPGVPSPDNVVTTLDQTVKQVTSTDPTTTPPSSTGPTQTKTPSTTKKPVAKPVAKPVSKPAAGRASRATTPQMAALSNWSAPTSFDAAMPAGMALPPATGISAAAGSAPAIAPLLMPQTQHVTPSAALTDLDKHTGSPVRAILLTLALAAAAGVGYGHLRVVRG